jgi:ATP-dependent RNA helicase DeaD
MEVADMPDFLTLGIRPEMMKTLEAHRLTEPTPIQEQAVPILLAGKDVIAQAQTGTGKTLAFVLPIMEKVDPQKAVVQALIITPTRELAIQVTAEVKKMVESRQEVKVLAVYGGQDVEAQMKKLKGAQHVVIATPGRLLDHLRRGTIDLSNVSMLVLDEADQMLHMGFLPEVKEIIKNTSSARQTMLFSATMPEEIRSLAANYMNNPTDIRVKSTQVTVEDIEQIVVETTDRAKQGTLLSLLETHRPFLAMIFCRTKRRASTLNEALLQQGLNSDELHGDLSQAKRESVMKRFREAKLQFLVATDVAARGLDVEGVSHVFNYDIPQDVESYIHRIGRTGRAGGKGLAITLVAPKDKMYLDLIEKGINGHLERIVMENVMQTAPNSHEDRPRGAASRGGGRGAQQGKDRPRSAQQKREGDRGQGRNTDSGGNRNSNNSRKGTRTRTR